MVCITAASATQWPVQTPNTSYLAHRVCGVGHPVVVAVVVVLRRHEIVAIAHQRHVCMVHSKHSSGLLVSAQTHGSYGRDLRCVLSPGRSTRTQAC